MRSLPRGVLSPSALAEGESTNLGVRVDDRDVSLYRLVRYSTGAGSPGDC